VRTDLWGITYLSDGVDKKKPQSCQRFRETLIPADANDAEARVLEWDERWSFVLRKTNQAWIWIALCRKTRQVVAYASREIEVKKPAAVCGKPFLKHTVPDSATPIFGLLVRRCFQKSSIRRSGRNQEKRLM